MIEFTYAVYYSGGRYGVMIHDEYPTNDDAEKEIERLKPMYPDKNFWIAQFQIKPFRDSGWFIYPLRDREIAND